MSYTWLGLCCNLFQLAALVGICVQTYRLLDKKEYFYPLILFLFGMVALMASEVFWMLHGIIRPGFRFPYSSSEVSQDGALLLLAAGLISLMGRSRARLMPVTIGSICFTAVNIALWIVWSGEWFKDIFDGLIFMYFVCAVSRCISRTEGLSRKEWIVLTIAAVLLMAGEASLSVIPSSALLPVDICNYALMFAILIFFYIKVIRSMSGAGSPTRSLCLAYGGFTWALFSMYMSAEPMYFVGYMSTTFMIVMMFLALRRVVRKA